MTEIRKPVVVGDKVYVGPFRMGNVKALLTIVYGQ